MRKRFVFVVIIFLLLFSKLSAQVYNGDLFLSTQSQVDAFNYTEVTGSLRIASSFFPPDGIIQNIDGLSELIKVGGDFYLSSTQMSNLDALVNLQSVGKSVFILENVISNIIGLSGLTSIGENLSLNGNFRLTDLSGLSNLTALGGGLSIERNPLLINVAVFSSLPITTLTFLTIDDNPLLTDLTGLSNLTSITGPVVITKNPSLTNLIGLSGITTVEGKVWINLNDNLANLDGLSGIVSIELGLTLIRNKSLTNLDGLSNLTDLGSGLILIPNPNLRTAISITENPSLTDFCGLYNLFHSGEIIRNQAIPGNIKILDNGANTVALTTQQISVNADQGLCSAKLSEAIIGNASIVGCLEPFSTLTHTDFPQGFIFSVGVHQITWTVTDGANNTASAIQTITVADNQPTTITCPGNITVKCASDVPAVDINSVTATDNCTVVVMHISDIISNQTCANRFTLTRTYMATDVGGNTATCTQVITVKDDVSPQITGLSVSQTALWPPNHTMRDITLSYTATDNCEVNPNITVSVNSNEPVNGTADGDTDPDWEIIDDHHIRLRAERAANGNGRIYTVTVTVDDGCNPPVSASTQVMVTHNITGPLTGKPFKVGSTVDFSGVFWDKPGNKHVAQWLIDGNTSAKGLVTEPAGNNNGKVTGSYKFNTAGVYKLQMNVTDLNKITSYATTNGDLEEIIVVYDPNGGGVYGGGWFNSPAGALKSNPAATGKVSYGFALNYFKNATLPKGETQFEFKAGDFEYNAVNFDYLSVSGTKAQFKGSGKIAGGQSGVNFMMTVVDGDLDGSEADKVRIKIYNKNTGQVYYDNQPGASDADNPTTVVGLNSSIVIQNTNNIIAQKTMSSEEMAETVKELEVKALPNPTSNNFTLTIRSNNRKDKIIMQVVDVYGRIIEVRNVAEQTIKIGDKYSAGAYFVKIIQGEDHKQLKLVKLSN